MSNDREIVERLIGKVEEMRKAQRDYFAQRKDSDKRKSIALEAEVDKWLRILRRRGYDPDKYNSAQPKML